MDNCDECPRRHHRLASSLHCVPQNSALCSLGRFTFPDCSTSTSTDGLDAELEPDVSLGIGIGSANEVLVVIRRIFGGWSRFAPVASTS